MTTTNAPVAGTLRDVLDAFTRGTSTTLDISRTTGLDRDLVEIALTQLTALGLVTRDPIESGCPEGGCGGCPAPTGRGCTTPTDTRRTGHLVTLRLGHRLD